MKNLLPLALLGAAAWALLRKPATVPAPAEDEGLDKDLAPVEQPTTDEPIPGDVEKAKEAAQEWISAW